MDPEFGRVLVTGGVRSGKSRHAERLLWDVPGVTYIATGYPADPADAEWSRRVARHQASRPSSWTTVETRDVAGALDAAEGPVLIDCIGLWLTRTLDALDAWDAPQQEWIDDLEAEIERIADAWRRFGHAAVAVTNEVGWGVVPDHRAGRVFADNLGRTNQHLAAGADDVVLCIAGRTLRI
jgi:adenosylcobinamide kinase/adenosylcobinamide-phosphate guanylyltransferase